MPRIVVIGGSGHIGTYLIPRLVELGYDVVNVSRGKATPYTPNAAWAKVEQVVLDRQVEQSKGTFGSRIVALRPDIVIDMIAFKVEDLTDLVTALRGHIQHYIFCSTIWTQGFQAVVPWTEDGPMNAIDDYGKNKAKAEEYLWNELKSNGFPATSFRPGHIVGPGWPCINPQANTNLDVFNTIARGEELILPNFGLEMLHHVHADDCAQWVICAIEHRDATLGQAFNTVSAHALTLRGYAEEVYRHFDHEPKLKFVPYHEWNEALPEQDARMAYGHIARSPCASIEKSRKLIGYNPRYSSLDGIKQAIDALVESGKISKDRVQL